MSAYHVPVLLNQSVSALNIKTDGIYVDATFGGGGHSAEILRRLGAEGKLVVFDQDADALANVPDDGRVIPIHGNFRFIHNYLKYRGYGQVDGILADLGVSSHQFDTGGRGFSFRFDAPLDMRMNTLAEMNAEDIVNNYEEEDLERIFRLYGEVAGSRRVATLICRARADARIRTTGDLDRAIESVLPQSARSKYLAKVYQALRIEVNHEMASLEGLMDGACKSLKPGGIFSVITYHSLEDRIVKNYFKSGNASGVVECDIRGKGSCPYRQVNRKPVLPDEEETGANPRARSAKLRIAQKV
mgnify:CR=1 FL=1